MMEGLLESCKESASPIMFMFLAFLVLNTLSVILEWLTKKMENSKNEFFKDLLSYALLVVKLVQKAVDYTIAKRGK